MIAIVTKRRVRIRFLASGWWYYSWVPVSLPRSSSTVFYGRIVDDGFFASTIMYSLLRVSLAVQLQIYESP